MLNFRLNCGNFSIDAFVSYNCISGKLGSNLILVDESRGVPPAVVSSTTHRLFMNQDLQDQILIHFGAHISGAINSK